MAYNAITTATNPYVPQFKALMAQYPGMAPSTTIGIGGFVLIPTSPYYPKDFAAANGLTGLPLLLNYRDVANGVRNTLDIRERALPGRRRARHAGRLGPRFGLPVQPEQGHGRPAVRLCAVLEGAADPEQRRDQPLRRNHRPGRARSRARRRVPRHQLRHQDLDHLGRRQGLARTVALPAGHAGGGGRRRTAPREVRVQPVGGDPDRRHRGPGRQCLPGGRRSAMSARCMRKPASRSSRPSTPTSRSATTITRASATVNPKASLRWQPRTSCCCARPPAPASARPR
jgi:hypothetical protein